MRSSRTARCALLAGALAGLSLLGAGCSCSTPPSIASIGTTTASGAGSTNAGSGTSNPGAPPSETQLQQDSLKFAECMRSSGVPTFPDPRPGGGFLFRVGAGIAPSSPAFTTAQAKCRKLLPGGGPPAPGTTTHPSIQALARMVKVAQCMRLHGISDFPDPTTTVPSLPAGGGVIGDIDGVILEFPATIDLQSPAFTRAAAACKFPLHH